MYSNAPGSYDQGVITENLSVFSPLPGGREAQTKILYNQGLGGMAYTTAVSWGNHDLEELSNEHTTCYLMVTPQKARCKPCHPTFAPEN